MYSFPNMSIESKTKEKSGAPFKGACHAPLFY